MDNDQNQAEKAIDNIIAAIDRSAPIPVSTQLRGALEFGIASGDLPSGMRMPTIRSLAQKLSLSPVTVSGVYAALRNAALLESRVGAGTFVQDHKGRLSNQMYRELDERIVELVRLAQVCGLSREELALRVGFANVPSDERPLRVMFIGVFPLATEGYAEEVRGYLPNDEVLAMTYADFYRAPPSDIDAYVTTAMLQKKVQRLAKGAPVISTTMLVNRKTRVALASIPSESRVLGYSFFSNFMTTMRTGIERYAPQIAGLKMIARGDPDLDTALAGVDVVIYASGGDYIQEKLGPHQTCFEYRHTPDRHSIETNLLPALNALRTASPTTGN